MTKFINNMETITIKKLRTENVLTILSEDAAHANANSQEEYMAMAVIAENLLAKAKATLVESFGDEKKWAIITITPEKLIRLLKEENPSYENLCIYSDKDVCLSLYIGEQSVSLIKTTLDVVYDE